MFREIRECLKLDPEHKKCFPLYKKIKEVSKFLGKAESSDDANNPQGCIDSAERVLRLELTVKPVRFTAFQLLCKCYNANSEPSQAIDNCQEALKIRREPTILCDSAEAYLANELYDDGNVSIRALRYDLFSCNYNLIIFTYFFLFPI